MSESSRRPKVITCQIPVRITNRNIKSRYNSKQANSNNLKEVKTLPLIGSRTKNFEFGPSILLVNTMSLLPKIDEVSRGEKCNLPKFAHETNPCAKIATKFAHEFAHMHFLSLQRLNLLEICVQVFI